MNRVEAQATAGSGVIVSGKAGEEVAEITEKFSIMEIDVLFGLLGPYELPLSGLIMLAGLVLTVGAFIKKGKG